MITTKLLRLAAALATAAAGAALAAPAAHAEQGDRVTFTSQLGSTVKTSTFSEAGPWAFSWTFTDTATDTAGQPVPCDLRVAPVDSSNTMGRGSYDNRTNGSGTSYEFTPGTYSLAISSTGGCQWSVTAAPSTQAPLGASSTFSSTTTGNTGTTPRVGEDTPWTLSWTYSCPSAPYPEYIGFNVSVNSPKGASSGLSSGAVYGSGTSGQGSQAVANPGEYSFTVSAPNCRWTLTTAPSASHARCSTALPSGSVVGMAATPDGHGYWLASRDGTVAACGDAPSLGSNPTPGVAAIAAEPDGVGYWLVTASGKVTAFGDATDHGSITGPLAKPIVAMAADPSTGGYWLLGADGGVFSYDAPFLGSTGNIRLNKPAVGLEATGDGGGYLFVASDGGIFAYGDAPFFGSTGGLKLNKPVVGMAIDAATGGYWLDAADGGIFAFNAEFHGSTGNITLAQPCVGMTGMPDGGGYRFVAADGGIFDFGDGGFEGSAA